MATQQLPADLREFLKLLNSKRVEYLLVGGYAVGCHGYPRATADMDIWVAISPRNAAKLVTVLQEFGFNVPAPTMKYRAALPKSCGPFLTQLVLGY
jgi:phage replication-related protein YjqB (UPF0714/DUF867 family)